MGEFRVHHIRFFDYQPEAIHCLAYEEEFQRLAVSRSDGSIEIWNQQENFLLEKLLPPNENRSVEAVVWCGKRLFSAGLHGDLHEYDLLTGEVKHTVSSNSGPVWCLALNDDKTKIAAGTEDGCIVLFDVKDAIPEYSKSLDKQEGRILSLAWYCPENVIVTGGIDNLRVWSLSSGHAIQRLTVPRAERNQETLVWAVAVTRDFTIVSGDSRGKTCFWNGRQGTLIKSFQSHKADVLALCVNKEGTSVFSSGIDPLLTQFEYIAANPSSDWKMWVKSTVRSQHTHDVRAVALVKGGDIMTGGVDPFLIYSAIEGRKGIKPWKRLLNIPQAPLASVASQAQLLMLRYPDYLEIWRLGSTSRNSDKDGEVLQLKTNPMKLLQLKSRDAEYILCADISPDGSWLAYSDHANIRLFTVTIEDLEVGCPRVSVTKVRHHLTDLQPASQLTFSPEGSTLVCAANDGSVQVVKLDPTQPQLVHTLRPQGDKHAPASPLCLSVSKSGKMAAVGDLSGSVHIYNVQKGKHVCSVPHYPHKPTSVAFHPDESLLAVVYTNQVVVEYDIASREYTDWCRQHMNKFPNIFKSRYPAAKLIMYNPGKPDQIIMHNGSFICILDKTQPFPTKRDIFSAPQKTEEKHAFHICTKYRFVMHLAVLEGDYMVVVERPIPSMSDALPPRLKQKKFGT